MVLILVVVDNGLVLVKADLGTALVENVLILVVVDNGLVLVLRYNLMRRISPVLILVVVDNGLVPCGLSYTEFLTVSLNPCCSGRWSRTLCFS